MGAAFAARPVSHAQGLFATDVSALRTPLVDLRHPLSLPLVFVFEPAGVADFFACGQRHEAFGAQVCSDWLKIAALSADSRERFDVLFADEADVVLSSSVLRDGAATPLGRTLSRPPNADQPRHLREAERPLPAGAVAGLFRFLLLGQPPTQISTPIGVRGDPVSVCALDFVSHIPITNDHKPIGARRARMQHALRPREGSTGDLTSPRCHIARQAG